MRWYLLFILLAVFGSTLQAQTTNSSELTTQVQNMPAASEEYPVIFGKDTLFFVKTNLGPYSAKERAESIAKRLKQLVDGPAIVSDSFHIINQNNYSNIFYIDSPIMSISAEDAAIEGKTQEQISAEYLLSIKRNINTWIKQRTFSYLVPRIIYTLLAIAGLFLVLFLINKSFKWINYKLDHLEKGLKQNRKSVFRYLTNNTTSNIFVFVSKGVRVALIVFFLFLYLPFMFSFLPWTQHLASTFYGYIATPVKTILNSFLAFIPNLFSILVVIIIARYFLRILVYVANEIEAEKLKIKGFHQDWAKPTYNLVKILIYALALVFIFQYLPSSKAFHGVSIFVGVIFTLGSTSAISNMIAGIVITYMRPFVVGDRVKIGETIGDVTEKNLLVTRLQTIKNEDITIPNATIINTHLLNYSKNASAIGIILHTNVTIGYDVPSQTVTDLLLKAANNTKNLTRDFKPFVLYKSLSDFYVDYELNVYTKQPKKMAHFYSELHKNILIEFNKANVEILSPHYSAYRDGNASTVPKEKPAEPSKNVVTNVIDKLTGQA